MKRNNFTCTSIVREAIFENLNTTERTAYFYLYNMKILNYVFFYLYSFCFHIIASV